MQHITGTMMIGVGGEGSALLNPLAALLATRPECWPPKGKPSLTIVDGDAFEEKNLCNQCITPEDVGKNKAEWAACLVSGLVDADPWPEYISGKRVIESWLTSQLKLQSDREAEGLFGGVAIILIPVDNDHCRQWVYQACEALPRVNVLIVDPSNGAGDDADVVDVVTWVRLWDGDAGKPVEAWVSPYHKYAQLQHPKGRNPKAGCAEKAESLPQLRTANMLAATLAYDCVERFISQRGMPEGYTYTDAGGLRVVGDRLPFSNDPS